MGHFNQYYQYAEAEDGSVNPEKLKETLDFNRIPRSAESENVFENAYQVLHHLYTTTKNKETEAFNKLSRRRISIAIARLNGQITMAEAAKKM